MDVALLSIFFLMHIPIETGQRFQSVSVTHHDIICAAIDGLRTARKRRPSICSKAAVQAYATDK